MGLISVDTSILKALFLLVWSKGNNFLSSNPYLLILKVFWLDLKLLQKIVPNTKQQLSKRDRCGNLNLSWFVIL